MTTYTAIISGNGSERITTAEFPRILDCVRYTEAYGAVADRCDIYSDNGKRVAQYRKPKPGTYPAAIGVWVNAKIY